MVTGPAAIPPLERLHPILKKWVNEAFAGELTEAQSLTLPHLLAGHSVLLSSPTGSGKTLAGFLGVLDHLIRQWEAGALPQDQIAAVYVSPLRALTYDIQKNLSKPLAEMGLAEVIRVGMRTGDTSAAERTKLRRKPPHILLTTPESLAILLPQEVQRKALSGCRFVIVDELHALAENKRGAHLSLSLERLERIAEKGLIRVGLSATAAPLPLLGELLVGSGRECEIVEARMARERRVEVLSPLKKDPYPPAGFTAQRVLDDIAQLVTRKRSVIVFCNTRSATESLALRLKRALPKLAERIEAHHASLDRDVRLEVEDRLKNGDLRAVVCSTSLELGVDIGSVDCVVMISTPKGISRALQRIGRSGHSIHQSSHGVLVATNVNDLMECVVCAEMTRATRLDEVRLMESPLDVLAQHVVGMAMEGDYTVEEAFQVTRRARGFADVQRAQFDRVLAYLKGGGRSLEQQYAENFGKVIEVDGRLALPSKKVGREYMVNVGVIHTEGMVRIYLGKRRLGQVEESFFKRLKIGDVFVLAGRMLRLIESGVGEAKVEEARLALPTVPAWNANKMPLSSGLAREVREFRSQLALKMESARVESLARRFSRPVLDEQKREELLDWLVERFEISGSNAQAILNHCLHQLQVSCLPTAERFLIERYEQPTFEPEAVGPDLVHYFFHSLIGRAANDALSRILAWRVKQAVGGNAMVTIDDYGFLLTLKSFQELDVAGWQELFGVENAEADMRSALEDSQLVQWNFRGVAQTGLMVPRNLPGEERRVKQLRWSAEILWRVLTEHEPDHPLLEQAYREATHSFLDLPEAMRFLGSVQNLEWHFVEVPVVSPFAFGMYASKIKEGMMLEDPEEAIERLWRSFQEGVGRVIE
jgi:ATP-dependent helicase Lhr and Lhr-like helicase